MVVTSVVANDGPDASGALHAFSSMSSDSDPVIDGANFTLLSCEASSGVWIDVDTVGCPVDMVFHERTSTSTAWTDVWSLDLSGLDAGAAFVVKYSFVAVERTTGVRCGPPATYVYGRVDPAEVVSETEPDIDYSNNEMGLPLDTPTMPDCPPLEIEHTSSFSSLVARPGLPISVTTTVTWVGPDPLPYPLVLVTELFGPRTDRVPQLVARWESCTPAGGAVCPTLSQVWDGGDYNDYIGFVHIDDLPVGGSLTFVHTLLPAGPGSTDPCDPTEVLEEWSEWTWIQQEPWEFLFSSPTDNRIITNFSVGDSCGLPQVAPPSTVVTSVPPSTVTSTGTVSDGPTTTTSTTTEPPSTAVVSASMPPSSSTVAAPTPTRSTSIQALPTGGTDVESLPGVAEGEQPGPQLSATGVQVGGPGAVGLFALFAGGALVLLARRRTQRR
ncbi:hypothetical protein GIS00_01250 [Nakamurella sp. YIM 132087]|uniref:Uncharacterized protein n=1 Tax=Nakamurella alba TaxID=2665158 RepID=A0A7K1FER7_9ACTN|nr:hypothetical protein [Nakamurella alba]MTD12570.1 hypothetical protein [Nakamurella alba]